MSRRQTAGFTLIEVMIALSIFALLSIVGYKGVSSLIETRARIEVEDGKWQQLVLFFDRIELDLRQSVNRPARSRDDVLDPAMVGQPSFAGDDGAQLIFSRFGDPDQAGFLMDTRRVGYRLHEGAVELLVWPALDLAPNARPEVFQVLPHVAQMSLLYLDAGGQWQNAWPDAKTLAQKKIFAPAAIQLSIRLESGEAVSRVFSL